ncbi:MAG: hypothetical protein ACHP9T_11330 [Caulobacterales bacterium]|jgi:hypothetical protein
MTDQDSVRDDIAFMRGLAEAGRSAPLQGGSILMAAGLIFGACALATWMWVAQATTPLFMPVLWFGGVALFLAILFAVRRRLPAKSGSGEAAALVWAGAGWAVFVIVLSLVIMGYRVHAGWIMAAICPVVLATYGAAWTVAGLLAHRAWIRVVGMASFVMALVCAWYALDVRLLFLIYAFSLFGLVALPGFILMQQARKAVA